LDPDHVTTLVHALPALEALADELHRANIRKVKA
jgi:hypothetical protein